MAVDAIYATFHRELSALARAAVADGEAAPGYEMAAESREWVRQVTVKQDVSAPVAEAEPSSG